MLFFSTLSVCRRVNCVASPLTLVFKQAGIFKTFNRDSSTTTITNEYALPFRCTVLRKSIDMYNYIIYLNRARYMAV